MIRARVKLMIGSGVRPAGSRPLTVSVVLLFVLILLASSSKAVPTLTPTPCPLTAVFNENFDSVAPPTLPAGWVAANAIDPDGIFWVTSNSGLPTPVADSAPNAAFIDDPATVSDKRLDSPSLAISSAVAQLTFRNNYNLEGTFDGGVLEISLGGGGFTDIIAAGGSFATGGYNATISTSFGNPIGGRMAWSGNSNGFITTTVNLPAAAAGQNIKVRWRMASDNDIAIQGWRIDSIVLLDCLPPTPTPTPMPIATPCSSPATVFSQNFDGVTPPALPAGWVATNAVNPDAILWVTSSSGVPAPVADSAPNAAFINDPATVSDKRLDSPSIAIFSAFAQLMFRNNYNLESTFDGGVLEVSIGGGAFTDIVTAGGSFTTGGYTATIATSFGSPIAGRTAWSGNSGGYATTIVNLPVAAAGQNIQVRWRMASDNGIASQGWRIDSIVVLDCLPPTPTPIPVPITVSLPTATFDNSVPIATVIIKPVVTTLIDPSLNYVGFQGDFTFDSAVVSFSSPFVQTAGLTSTNWNCSGSVLPNPPTGIRILRLSAFSLDFTPLNGAGTLFNLRMLRVSSTPGAMSLLVFKPDPDNFIFIDADLNTHVPNQTAGLITITGAGPTATPTPTPTPIPTPTPTPTLSISGNISYCSNPNPDPVPNVTLTLTGSMSGSTLSDSSGSYQFSFLTPGGSYTVTPTKSAVPPGSPSINTVDVVATQRHFLQIALLSGCRLKAADVNGDNTVNTVDALAIRQFFFGHPTANVGKYSFSPSGRSYPGVVSNQTAQNYDVLIFGDVASPFADRPGELTGQHHQRP